MSMKLGDTFPDYSFDTTYGKINFYEWLGDRLARAVDDAAIYICGVVMS